MLERLTDSIFGWIAEVLGISVEQEQESNPPALSDADQQIQFLCNFLRRETVRTTSRIYFWGANGTKSDRAVLSGGGYELLHRLDSSNAEAILGLDKPIALGLPIDTWRARASVAAREVGVQLIPLSYTAYERIRVDGHAPQLVQRKDYEAVFSIADKFYLSAYDEQESPPLYFLCRLPHAVSTVDEAREALKPESVKSAEKSGAAVLRQGDLFFIETELDDVDVRIGARSVVADTADPKERILYGTAHCADEVAHLHSGVMMAKGTVTHSPSLIGQWRDGDHADLNLPDGWWIVSRNTVPATAGAPAPGTANLGLGSELYESWFGALGLNMAPWQRDFVDTLAEMYARVPQSQPSQPWVITRDEPGEEG